MSLSFSPLKLNPKFKKHFRKQSREFKFRVLGLFEERKEALELFLRRTDKLCLKCFLKPLFGFMAKT
jgi:hypothetical protein